MADANEHRLKVCVHGGISAADRAITALRRRWRVTAYRVHSEVTDVLLRAEMVLDMGKEPLPVLVRVQPEPIARFLTRD